MSIAYINIGSNMGNRNALIEQAITHIEFLCGSRCKQSPVIESEPWGFESPHPFLNIGISIECNLDPLVLLQELLKIEKSISNTSHRDENGNYIDRLIDIDLIAVDDIVIDSPTLQLPHPRMHLRDFVLSPMMHLNSSWVHPIFNQSITELYNQLHEKDNKPMG
ncbi:MAG: 2-amino-4-hydroxy-6-hydroxymethyldihydropteridine diphosphokinase [Muribaculaceae bacterium]|nr:2-amino-4-hydroxy-6-hydroxymethyldihydropteridine diphosphokinase [Muribaculaceae bacterium]